MEERTVITQEEFEEFTEACKDAMTCPRLDEWETRFMEGFRVKFEIYGLNIFMSDKQAGILRRIAKEKIYV